MNLLDPDQSTEGDREEPAPYDYAAYGVALAVMVPVFFFFRHIGKTDMGLNAGVLISIFIVAIRVRWDLRKRIWFWVILALVLAAHIPLLLFVPWPDSWIPGLALLPIGVVDMSIILGAVAGIEKIIER